jgi:hypothetical protein
MLRTSQLTSVFILLVAFFMTKPPRAKAEIVNGESPMDFLRSQWAAPVPAPKKRDRRQNSYGSEAGSSGSCAAIRSRVVDVVGEAKARCYMKLFSIETGCRYNLTQRKGNAGNPNVGYGLCSLEKSPAIRRVNRRGPHCEDISTIEQQVRCCQAIMRERPDYFGPVLRGKVPQCG